MRSAGRLATLAAVVLAVLAPSPASQAGGLKLTGRWWTPLGVMSVSQQGKKVSGTIAWKCKVCPFKRGEQVFKGVILEDSLAGQVRFCLKGQGCKGDGWAPLVMLVAREGRVLSGAAHFKASDCAIGGKGKKEGLVMRKLRRRPKVPKPVKVEVPDAGTPDAAQTRTDKPEPDAIVDEKGESMEAEVAEVDPKQYEANSGSWQKEMESGAGFMEAGRFEKARRHFRQAIDLDPTRPEAFNGIGVTYYARSDYQEALNWYKKALEVDANFGDAYYNMACIYSLQKKVTLALRYLHIAALNGFVQPQVLEQDPDLNNLRSDARYQKIVQQMVKGAK